MKLSVEERDLIFNTMNEQQKAFLNDSLYISRRSVFANRMAKEKGLHLPPDVSYEDVEVLLDDWVYVGFIDAGHVSTNLRCECGRPLRYQHKVEHKVTKDVKKFGIQHLQEHMAMDAKLVKDIVDGFDFIDLELDEVLRKYARGWTLSDEGIQMPDEGVPAHIQDHMRLGLPLLNRQVAMLRRLVERPVQIRSDYVRRSKSVPERANHMPVLFEDEGFVSEERDPDRLSMLLQQRVLAFLDEGLKSARVISELLIRDGLIYEGRFISNKPHVYVPVCFYLDSLVVDGVCVLLEANQTDRHYELKSFS